MNAIITLAIAILVPILLTYGTQFISKYSIKQQAKFVFRHNINIFHKAIAESIKNKDLVILKLAEQEAECSFSIPDSYINFNNDFEKYLLKCQFIIDDIKVIAVEQYNNHYIVRYKVK